jgi:hypothetical protein
VIIDFLKNIAGSRVLPYNISNIAQIITISFLMGLGFELRPSCLQSRHSSA